MTKRKKILLWAVSLVGGLGAVFLFSFVFYGDRIGRSLRARAFDARVWTDREATGRPPYPRRRMVADLLAKQNFIGQSRRDVIGLLGEPEETDYVQDYDLVYWLGPERGLFQIDSEWFVLKLNAEGKVTECRVVTD